MMIAVAPGHRRALLAGTAGDCETGTITRGEPGANGQHSFCQRIHQGTKFVACNLIGFARWLNPLGRHHGLPMSNVFALAEMLAACRLGTVLAQSIVPESEGAAEPSLAHDSSMDTPNHRCRRLRGL